MDDGLSCRVDAVADVPVVVVTGVLSLTSSLVVSRTLRKELLDRGRVLVDVSAMRVAPAAAVSVFPTVLAAVGGWPAARMVLYGAPAAIAGLLRSTARTTGVHLADDRDHALRLLDVRPARVRCTHPLPAGPLAAAFARSLVRTACEDWSLGELRQRAETVANELVSNAVEHSTGESVLVLSLDRRGLTVAVRDGSADVPRPAGSGGPHDERYGMRLVEGMSDGWGVTRHDSGKTVWALLRAAGADRPRDGR